MQYVALAGGVLQQSPDAAPQSQENTLGKDKHHWVNRTSSIIPIPTLEIEIRLENLS